MELPARESFKKMRNYGLSARLNHNRRVTHLRKKEVFMSLGINRTVCKKRRDLAYLLIKMKCNSCCVVQLTRVPYNPPPSYSRINTHHPFSEMI
jgi:hypothetical protein